MLEYCQQRDVGRGSSVDANRTLSYSRKIMIVGCLKEDLFTLGLAVLTFENGYGFVGELTAQNKVPFTQDISYYAEEPTLPFVY